MLLGDDGDEMDLLVKDVDRDESPWRTGDEIAMEDAAFLE